ncbi:hypothetical protein [Streptomyces coerulescens]|uniref:Secreted protein n=1 Tax=Streptomyces coerulescens TaxID=29304 RepID=A0ABW0CX64_STRCD
MTAAAILAPLAPSRSIDPVLISLAAVTGGVLRGCFGLQAGEESDSCGAGQEKLNRRQGDSVSATVLRRPASSRCRISELRDRRADLD